MASVSDDHLHCTVHFTETLFLDTHVHFALSVALCHTPATHLQGTLPEIPV